MGHNLKPYEPQFEDRRGDEDDLRLKWDASNNTLSIVNHKGQQPWTRGGGMREDDTRGTSLLRFNEDGELILCRHINSRIAEKAGLVLSENNRLTVRDYSGIGDIRNYDGGDGGDGVEGEKTEEEEAPEYTGSKTFSCRFEKHDKLTVSHDRGDALLSMSGGKCILLPPARIDEIIEQLKAVKAAANAYKEARGDY